MNRVVLKCYTTSGDYDGPCSFCYVDIDAALADCLCEAIEVVRGLKLKSHGVGPFGGLYAAETFANPAYPFNTKWSLLASGPVLNREEDQTLDEFMDGEGGDEPFMVKDGAIFATDTDTIRIGTDTMVIKDDAVLFQFSCKHSAGDSESYELPYETLLEMAGRGPRTLEVTWHESTTSGPTAV